MYQKAEGYFLRSRFSHGLNVPGFFFFFFFVDLFVLLAAETSGSRIRKKPGPPLVTQDIGIVAAPTPDA